MASLALAVINLRADFEAQRRRIARAEDTLVRCRTTKAVAFDVAATALRSDPDGERDAARDGSRTRRITTSVRA
jgi:hypothetical protein